MFHENAKRASSTPVSKKRATWKLEKIDVFQRQVRRRSKQYAISQSRNHGMFDFQTLCCNKTLRYAGKRKTLRYAEMIRITKRKRFGQRLRMIICLRESRKNANIGDQFSKLTRRKTFKNDEIVISQKRKTPRHNVPLSNVQYGL